jgi:acetolactate synthase-1/2/3 large subunit
MAEGMGVEAASADTAERFADLLAGALNRSGPFLIELLT